MNFSLKATVMILLLCTTTTVLLGTTIEKQLEGYSPYNQLKKDYQFQEDFNAYIDWMKDKSPDADAIYKMIQAKDNNIFTISQIFHEEVELNQWLLLGNKLDEIMNVEYYKNTYPAVYPIAHKKSILEEFALINYFAQRNGYPELPDAAYALASPLPEYFDVPLAKSYNRFKFNWLIRSQTPVITKEEIETAAEVYEKGGYNYKDKDKIINNAVEFVKGYTFDTYTPSAVRDEDDKMKKITE